MARVTGDVGTSTITSTFSVSYHRRAIVVPTATLFWWSANTTSTFRPLAAAPKSSTAMSAATLDPGPARVAYGPDSSFRTPILTTPSEIWAWTGSAVRLTPVKSANAALAKTSIQNRPPLTPPTTSARLGLEHGSCQVNADRWFGRVRTLRRRKVTSFPTGVGQPLRDASEHVQSQVQGVDGRPEPRGPEREPDTGAAQPRRGAQHRDC